MQFATMKYEIIRKLMVLETVEVNLLKSAHYYQKQNLQMIPYLFNRFQRSKWEGLRNLAEIEINEGCDNISNYANMDRP